MSPQFVDYDADGQLDIVTATFDGSPYVARGTQAGFEQPVVIRDKQGRRLLLDQYWDYETASWTKARREGGGAGKDEQCISAVALDWDVDGDLDLLLGDYKTGHMYVQINVGSAKEPAFEGVNIPVEAGGKVLSVEKNMTAPQVVDWDGDGRLDIVYGTFGDVWGMDGTTGGVFLLRNTASKGFQFAAPVALIPVVKKSGHALPTRPEGGLYAQAADYDGDGDLDLLVGGYGMWKPEQPELDAAQLERLAAIKDELETLDEERGDLLDEALELEGEERDAALKELTKSEAWKELSSRMKELGAEKDVLQPGDKREASVWLYERISG